MLQMKCVHALCIALLTALLPFTAHAQPTTGTLRGSVSAQPADLPLGYAVISLPQLSIERFTDDQGRFTLIELTPGRYDLLVRRVGFSPYRGTVVIERGVTTTTAVQLTPIPVQLASVTVEAPSRCVSPGAPNLSSNRDVAALVSLLRENAERYRLLVSEHPFVYAQVRTLGTVYSAASPFILQQVDTSVTRAVAQPGYRPGRVVRRERASDGDMQYIMSIPSIIDLADDAFARTHCFSYGGRETHDSETWLRLDVRAFDKLPSPDVHGSFYLDSATSQLRSMRLELSRPDRLPRELGGIAGVMVFTRFLEIAPGLSIVQSMCGVSRPTADRRRRIASAQLQGELQELASYRFTNPPVGVLAANELPVPRWSIGGELSRSALWCMEE